MPGRGLAARFAAAMLWLLAAGAASAAVIDFGSPDFEARWDNALRYNLGVRVDERDDQIGSASTTDEGTWRFDQGDLVTNRLDILSEFSFAYAKALGLRVSGAGWYDRAYDQRSRSSPDPALSSTPSYENHRYSDYTQKRYAGPAAEWLDPYAFGNFSPGGVPLSVKAGRHSLKWGESLLLAGSQHSVAYAQSPINPQKSLAVPGGEARELFLPLTSISVQAQVTATLSLEGQYFLDWEASRLPEGGTHLGPADALFDGPDRQFLSPALGYATRGPPVEPAERGEYGLAARWSPGLLDGTVGFYYRHYADKLPHVLLTQVAPNDSRYNLIYAGGIDLYGLSLSKQLGEARLGAEISYRHDTPLSAETFGVVPGLPERGETFGPRGDMFHGILNLQARSSATWLYDSATVITEATWNTYSRVRSGASLFDAVGYPPCAGKDKWDGCSTKQFIGLGLNFTPVWSQVFRGVDLLAPVAGSGGVHGNSAAVLGGSQGAGSYNVGVAAHVQKTYRIELRYVDFFGHISDSGAANGLFSLLRDRGFAALTLKATF